MENIKVLNDHEARVAFMEIALFKSDKLDTRFEDIYRKLAEQN
jgi:hypothetical protein